MSDPMHSVTFVHVDSVLRTAPIAAFASERTIRTGCGAKNGKGRLIVLGHAIGHRVAIVTAITLLLMPGGLAWAQTSDDDSAGSINLGARAGLAADAPVRIAPRHEEAVSPFEFSARACFASDYIYRGVTLSDHKPAVGAGLEATFGLFYAGATVTSVNLPTRPAAEITMNGGLRPKLDPRRGGCRSSRARANFLT